jgi:hypothetical protein
MGLILACLPHSGSNSFFFKSFNSVYSSEAVRQYGYGNVSELYQLA